MNKVLGTVIATITSFSAGIAIGLLLSPKSGKENRRWISKQTGEAKNWLDDHGSKLLKESEERLGKIAKGVKEALPDLYEATDAIMFEDDEFEDDKE